MPRYSGFFSIQKIPMLNLKSKMYGKQQLRLENASSS